jgi:aryl-alcohol dehydrogenase-like predicted oxidoreductase
VQPPQDLPSPVADPRLDPLPGGNPDLFQHLDSWPNSSPSELVGPGKGTAEPCCRNCGLSLGGAVGDPAVPVAARGTWEAMRQSVPMEFTHLGRTGLSVSRLCLGTMNFGPQTDPETSYQIMDAAHDYGINFFDTANRYGGQDNLGRTESILGDWFAQGGGRRERTVLATKVYGEMADWPNEGKLSALNLRRALDASLKRLQTDYVDLYQFHHVDRGTPWEEIWQALEVAVTAGKVLYVGSSNFAGWHIAQAQAEAARRNFLGLVSEQSIYNLLTRQVELEVLPACQHYGLGVIPWSPLHGGLLGGVIRKQNEGVRRLEGRAARTLEEHRSEIESFEALADELGYGPGDVALAWLLHQPGVTGPIIGPRTREQLDAAIKAVDIQLEPSVLERLDEIFPGHRTAPEDYAW